MRRFPTWFMFAAPVIMLLGVAVSCSVWNECRADGKSVLYCMTLLNSR